MQSTSTKAKVSSHRINCLCFAYYCASLQFPKYDDSKSLPSTQPKAINNKLPKIQVPNELCHKISLDDHKYFEKVHRNFKCDDLSNFYPDDVLRFVQGYSHEAEREKVTFSRINDLVERGSKKEFDFSNILKRDVMSKKTENECLKVWPLFMYGYDKQGHPIMYDEVCSTDIAQLEKCFNINDKYKKLKTFRFRFLKRLCNIKRIQSMRYGYNGNINNKGGINSIYKHVLVMDIGNFSIFNVKKFKDLMQSLIGEESNLWPNTLDKMYIINASWYFSAGWKIIKLFVHPITQEKIEIIRSGHIDSMKKRIDLDQIPKKYGGTGALPIKLGYAADYDNDILDGDYSKQSDPVDVNKLTCLKNKNY